VLSSAHIGRFAVTTKMCGAGSLLRLLMLMMMMMMMLGDAVSAAYKLPFRGEMSAVPRGLDILLGNVAARSVTPSRNPRRSDNGFVANPSNGQYSRS